MTKRQNKLKTYLAVTAGVGCVSSVANAAVTFYDGREGGSELVAGETELFSEYHQVFSKFGNNTNTLLLLRPGVGNEVGYYKGSEGRQFLTHGGDLNPNASYEQPLRLGNTRVSGISGPGQDVDLYTVIGVSESSGDFNDGYSNLNFAILRDDVSGNYDTVIAFYASVGYDESFIVAVSETTGVTQTISEGRAAMIAASGGNSNLGTAAVPEPSSLALLGLGSLGLLARRRRQAA